MVFTEAHDEESRVMLEPPSNPTGAAAVSGNWTNKAVLMVSLIAVICVGVWKAGLPGRTASSNAASLEHTMVKQGYSDQQIQAMLAEQAAEAAQAGYAAPPVPQAAAMDVPAVAQPPAAAMDMPAVPMTPVAEVAPAKKPSAPAKAHQSSPAPKPADKIIVKPGVPYCPGEGKNCEKEQCCSGTGLQCYAKNKFWATCTKNCTKGVRKGDKDGKPWSCNELGIRNEFDSELAILCARPGQDCRMSTCCAAGSCYMHNVSYGSCRKSCTPGPGDQCVKLF